jgi:hypothetical protein
MSSSIKFIKLMKSEPKNQKIKNAWIIDEGKFLIKSEVNKLKEFSNTKKSRDYKKTDSRQSETGSCLSLD